MALTTDDCDIRDTKLWMYTGGNGDYYLTLMEDKPFKKLDFRFAMSGGNGSRNMRVRNAFVELYRAMEEAGYNLHPREDRLSEG